MLWAGILYEEAGSQIILRAMPILLIVLCVLAIAYRYYSKFLALRVAALDDSRPTPAHTFNDGQNYHPTNKWVLFGHHFAAISGAGPLIGPVLAIQYGYMPGLLWLVIGVCLAGAVQDMLVLAASVRRNGKSLAEIARAELGPWANVIVSAAILFIVVIALAGLGYVVVKALGGEEVNLAKGMQIYSAEEIIQVTTANGDAILPFPEGSKVRYTPKGTLVDRPEKFEVRVPSAVSGSIVTRYDPRAEMHVITLPEGAVQTVPGSSWGTFTIACTIPIAFFVGLYMYKIRKGRVVEASLIGAAGVLAATIIGNWIPESPLGPLFSLNKGQTVFSLCAYGFIASVLPVWLLLCPRDYLSSFLKIGTIALLVIGVLVANPTLPCPQVNPVFKEGGPTFQGGIFPFVFICVMCGAISGFHSLVSSGTTPKMVNKESDIRPIGYASMLIEGLVGVVALIAAASLDPKLYYDINVDLRRTGDEQLQRKLQTLYKEYSDPLHKVGVGEIQHLDVRKADLAQVEEMVGNESLRGRTGGAVTLAVGMSLIFTEALHQIDLHIEGIVKYWYHFAIMFEALFILTTIDTGTRIARFLLQEAMGKLHPKFEQTDWLPGAAVSTLVVTAGWGVLIYTGSIDTIWPMFGIANQLLAVIALALVTTWLINSGRGRYAPVTIVPMLFVTTTTMTAGTMLVQRFHGMGGFVGGLNLTLTLFVMVSVGVLLLMAISRWVAVLGGMIPARSVGPRP